MTTDLYIQRETIVLCKCSFDINGIYMMEILMKTFGIILMITYQKWFN